MKRSGRTLKQRLYDLRHIGGYVRRARYLRGHGVHSPYVYSIVRQVFMSSKLNTERCDLYAALLERDVPKRRCVELQNLMEHTISCRWPHQNHRHRQNCATTPVRDGAATTRYSHNGHISSARSGREKVHRVSWS